MGMKIVDGSVKLGWKFGVECWNLVMVIMEDDGWRNFGYGGCEVGYEMKIGILVFFLKIVINLSWW